MYWHCHVTSSVRLAVVKMCNLRNWRLFSAPFSITVNYLPNRQNETSLFILNKIFLLSRVLTLCIILYLDNTIQHNDNLIIFIIWWQFGPESLLRGLDTWIQVGNLLEAIWNAQNAYLDRSQILIPWRCVPFTND